MHYLSGNISIIYMAAISASVSGVAYAIYALNTICHGCSDDIFEKLAAGIVIEKIIVGTAYLIFSCYLTYLGESVVHLGGHWS